MPKYLDIVDDLRNNILYGKYKNADKIDDEKALGVTYSASKLTIKKAVDILVQEGLLVKKQGSGTYINSVASSNPLLDPSDLTKPSSLTHEYEDKTATSKVLEFEIIKANEYIAKSLLLKPGDFVYKVYRVRYIDNEANSIEEVYMPINVIAGLDQDIVNHSIYDYIVETLKLKPKSFHKYIYSRPCNSVEEKELKMKKHDPVTIVEQIAFLDDGVPYEYSLVSHYYKDFKYKTVVVI
ncbi:GntR family transcriptional regulator [Breznakia pachnodae]|uniref:GntR family transcriptional regulator n=1 Tax=Breznakia pachnodae TaxID=265178 RepID=A0ABU0E044_9FIRM|nr:GntR family transcriptional regulator [Breznakia pachnodae]MDQ0359915.1 GntR family transcriptional regulator [Breznakia pachnodae]